jgi:hypothetical protein
MPRRDYRLLTFHLTGCHVQLVRNDSSETSNQYAQEVHIPVEKGICADKQDDYKPRVQHWNSETGPSPIPSEPNWFHIASATGICAVKKITDARDGSGDGFAP